MSIIDSLLPIFKLHADLAHDLDDLLASEMIDAAVSVIETETSISIHRRDMTESVSDEGGEIRPRFRPIPNRIDIGGRGYMLDASGSISVKQFNGTRIFNVNRQSYGSQYYNVSYSCGYDEAKQIPPNLRQAIFKLALHFMEHRGDSLNRQSFGASKAAIAGLGNPLYDSGADALLKPFRRVVA